MDKFNVLVSSLMSHPVISIPPETRVAEVFGLADREGVHHFPIIEHGALMGLVCTCDLRGARPDSKVWPLARRQVVTVSRTSSAVEAARLMSANAVGSAVVTDGDAVCGILTREDLASAAEELALLIGEGHCASCGTRQHLRAGPDSTYLCVDCMSRARGKDWFDFGGED